MELPLITNLELGPKLPLSVIRQAERSSVDWAEFAAVLPGVKLDERSRALVAAMAPSDWSRPGRALDERGLDELVAGFERLLAEDSAFNEHELHLEISTWFASGQAPRDLAELSAKVYDELFLTPASDPWLGMATPGIFTALTGDGVLVE